MPNYNKFYANWTVLMSIANLTGIASAVLIGTHKYWILASASLFIVYIASIPKYTQVYRAFFGLANWVTIFRICIIFIFIFNYSTLSNEFLFTGFLFVIILDGVDGYLARKLDQSSDVGANLDMEGDAFLALAISWIHFDQSRIGWWLLIPGSLKYIYELSFFWSKNKKESLPKVVRATIAVIFFLSLNLAFILPESYAFIILLISSFLIGASFVSSMYFDLKSI